MREILFRGKTESSKRWVVGDLLQWSDGEMCICENRNHFEKDKYIVIPETVGQYTGLTDKNGRRIFEGDIVYCKSRLDNANMVVIFECGQFRMVLSENYRSYQTNSGFYDINCFDKEVIGNAYDNPELLKGE